MGKYILKDEPETLVNRLNGIYTGGKLGIVGQYKASPLEQEAAREIVRLREALGDALDAHAVWRYIHTGNGTAISLDDFEKENEKPSEEG